ncbi:MAG: hypothetical protein ACLT98_16600 [Eggerthellaceae bacterium]
MEYADTVFVRACGLARRPQPCFLRDLDRGVMLTLWRATTAVPRRRDDVPLLDPERAELLSDELDLLLDRDCG